MVKDGIAPIVGGWCGEVITKGRGEGHGHTLSSDIVPSGYERVMGGF